jgi:hypothetical protein
MAAKPSIKSFACALYTQWKRYLSAVAVTAILIVAAAFLPDQLRPVNLLILIVGFLVVTYWIWAMERARVVELEKIDCTDLERMLRGRFLGRTFLYGAEIVLCKDYNGPIEIGNLKINFDRIAVPAPKNSVAGIRISFFHGRDAGQYLFEYRDGNNKVTSITNIYEDQQIYLDEQSCFALRVMLSEDFPLDQHSLVRVTVTTWAK